VTGAGGGVGGFVGVQRELNCFEFLLGKIRKRENLLLLLLLLCS
jgi:hypothetical protein